MSDLCWASVRRWLAGSEEPADRVATAQRLLLLCVAVNAVLFLVGLVVDVVTTADSVAVALLLAVQLAALALVRRGRVDAAVVTYVVLALVISLGEMVRAGGMIAPGWFGIPPLVLFVGVTASAPAAFVTAVIATLASLALVALEEAGRLPPVRTIEPEFLLINGSASLFITGGSLYIALRIISAARERLISKERARAELEKQLVQASRLETVGQLAAGVAHDFNNLLAVVFMETSVLARLEPAAAASAAQIREAADRAKALTRQLLTFGHRQVREPELLDLNAMVRRLEQLLGNFMGEDILLAIELGEHLPPVRVDRVELEQGLFNLVTNARDAMRRGGVVTIRTGTTNLADADAVYLSVRDTGVGMDTSVRARLFEPFFTTKDIGKGLGLATLHGLVTQAGGEIRVESSPGAGSSFTIALPAV